MGKSKTPGCLGSRAFLLTFGGTVFRTSFLKAPRRGDEANSTSDCCETSYAKISDPADAESDASSDLPVLTPSESTIPSDLEVVIEAWPSLTEEAKKKVLVVVKHEEAEWTESTSGTPLGQSIPTEIDRDLANFITQWPALEQAQRQALLTLAGVPKGQSRSSLSSLDCTTSFQHNASPSSEELFSESEWSRLVEHLALPERQAEILDLLIHGENDKQIARKLKISLPTLRTHLQRMYGRFNVSNRTSLVVELVRLGRGVYRGRGLIGRS